MALLNILHFPDPRLRIVAKPINNFDENLQNLITDMFKTMYHVQGVGLAATQVGINKRIAVMDVSQEKNQPLVLINPEILATRDNTKMQEGCLSVPGIYAEVTRATWVKFRALDAKGQSYILETENLFAECVQHEIDHLNGKLFIDYLSALKRQRIRDKLSKKN